EREPCEREGSGGRKGSPHPDPLGRRGSPQDDVQETGPDAQPRVETLGYAPSPRRGVPLTHLEKEPSSTPRALPWAESGRPVGPPTKAGPGAGPKARASLARGNALGEARAGDVGEGLAPSREGGKVPSSPPIPPPTREGASPSPTSGLVTSRLRPLR